MGHQGIIRNHLFYYPSIRPIKIELNSEVKCAKISEGQRATISVKMTKHSLTCKCNQKCAQEKNGRQKSARINEIVILTGIHLIATSFFVSLCSASFTSENAPLKYIVYLLLINSKSEWVKNNSDLMGFEK